jgi:hypothetical protein
VKTHTCAANRVIKKIEGTDFFYIVQKMQLYSSCGLFGLFKKKADGSTFCGPNTTFDNGKCISTVDVTSDN